MKRILFAILGVAAIAACSKTEVVSISEGNAIKFDNAFVGNPTKAGLPTGDQYGASKLPPHFFVYADNEDGNVFNGQKVYPANGVWVYDDLKQWTENKTYKFAAYVVKEQKDETVSFNYGRHELTIENFVSDNDRQTDLLLATSDEDLNPKNVKVPFTFKHALAMIKFTLKNGLGNNDLTISDFKIEGIDTKGNVKINNSDKLIAWESVGTPAEFTNEEITSTQAAAGVSDEFVVIPQNKEIKVTFTVTVTNKPDITKPLTATITVDKTNWECGKRYNYVATITGTDMDVIEFADPVVEDWADYNDPGTDFDF